MAAKVSDILVTLEHEVWRAKHKSFLMLRKVLAWSHGLGQAERAIGFWNQCANVPQRLQQAKWHLPLPCVSKWALIHNFRTLFSCKSSFFLGTLNKWREVFLSGKAQCLESPDSHNGPKSFAASCLPPKLYVQRPTERILETDIWEIKENSSTIYR